MVPKGGWVGSVWKWMEIVYELTSFNVIVPYREILRKKVIGLFFKIC